ncbi:phage major capsid protein [Pararhizobium sp. BT-229]|uniref:phage major capsid protein n=1 Tax=Pararhizobium sp. BT-229 TaxID=2986923 RepID=UPI0021F701CB|nr:phage major capsid protein [Pararhizobium sp. BT-229]MCV9965727.1 phage major capsid protein [Pararhizobium sp. BT-229]
MPTILEMREKQQKLVADARALLADIKDDTAEARVAELEGQHDAAMAEFDKLEARIKREEDLEARERDLNTADERRPVADTRGEKVAEKTADEKYQDAFRSFLRGGVANLSAEQRAIIKTVEERGQSVGTQTQGGYLVPGVFQAELVKSLKAWGPMLDPGVTRMLPTSTGATITMPTMNDTANVGALIGENQQVSVAEIAFGTKSIDAYKYTSGVVLVSDELLQDAVMDVEGIVRDAMGERIGRIANTHLTTGDGASKPNGIVTAAGTTAAAGAAAITFDDLINLEHSVDPAYRSDPSIKWMFNDATLKALRKLKDLEGNYIWQPADVKGGAPATILTYGYVINQAVADIGTTNKSVVFGAMNKYIVRMVKEFAIKRLVERYADYGQVGLIGFTRLDGELLDTAAVKTLLHP